MIPALTLIAGGRGSAVPVPDLFPTRRQNRQLYPVELLLLRGLNDSVYRNDLPVVFDHLARLGDLDRWDEDGCRRIEEETWSRWSTHPNFNERFVREKLRRVGGDGPVGQVARTRWISARLDRFTVDAKAAYRRQDLCVTPTHLAYLRALYVSCVLHLRDGPVDSAVNYSALARRSHPNG